jgi:hypothetical protein
MAKQKKDQTEQQTSEVETEITFDTVAVGHVQLPNGDFHMIRVPVNSATLQTGKVELGQKCADKLEAKYEFKIEAARNGLV